MNQYLFAFLVLSASLGVSLSDVCTPEANKDTKDPCSHRQMISNLACRMTGGKLGEDIDQDNVQKAYLTRIVRLNTLNPEVTEMQNDAFVSILFMKFTCISLLIALSFSRNSCSMQ